jgi:hypothetical protein
MTVVFRFRYLDRTTNELVLAEDWATAAAIAHMGGVIEPGSGMEVDCSEVSTTAGLLMRKRGAA